MNTLTVKVGLLPGRLTEVLVEKGTTAREIFELANVEITNNHETRLDGEKIDIDTPINEGRLIVGLRQIKGNR